MLQSTTPTQRFSPLSQDENVEGPYAASQLLLQGPSPTEVLKNFQSMKYNDDVEKKPIGRRRRSVICNKRLFTPNIQDRFTVGCTWGVFLSIGFLYFVCVIPIIQSKGDASTVFALLGAVIYICNLFFILAVSFIDPGVIVKSMEIPPSNIADMERGEGKQENNRGVFIDPSGAIKLCTTCKLYRDGYYGHHCRSCDYCVAGFDHHCILLGVCIAKRNRLFFILLLLNNSVSNFMCMYAAIFTITDIFNFAPQEDTPKNSFLSFLISNYGVFVCALLFVVASVFARGLCRLGYRKLIPHALLALSALCFFYFFIFRVPGGFSYFFPLLLLCITTPIGGGCFAFAMTQVNTVMRQQSTKQLLKLENLPANRPMKKLSFEEKFTNLLNFFHESLGNSNLDHLSNYY